MLSKKKNNIIDNEVSSELKTSNKMVIEFYKNNPMLNFEMMNVLFIDILNELMKGMSGDITKHMTDNINNTMIKLSNDIVGIKEQMKIPANNNDIINSIVIKLFDMKKDYISDMKTLIDKHESDNIIRIIERFDKETQKIINEVVPRTNNTYYNQYENMMKTFMGEIKGINQSEIFDKKYNVLLNNIEKSLLNYISTTENRLHTEISEIKTIATHNNTIQEKVNTELLSYLEKYKNSTYKGSMAENKIETIINTVYPSAEVKRTSSEEKSGDFIMSRENQVPILFEIKDYNRNIPSEEVNKFIRDVKEKDMCGVFISISTGISKKRNFQIDISDNNNIMVYIHNMNYESDKIKLCVDIIDNLYVKLKLNNKNDISISSELLNEINKEYSTFITKRTNLIEQIKENNKKTIQIIEEFEIKTLNDYLTSKFTFKNCNKLRCNICEKFVGTNNKSLAVHLRKCKKVSVQDTNEINSTDSGETNELDM